MGKLVLTEAKIKQWKKRFGEIHLVEVPLDNKGKETLKGVFHKPDLKCIAAAGRFGEDDPIRSGMIIFDNTLVACDDELKTNDEAKLAAIKEVGELFKIRQASIKKL